MNGLRSTCTISVAGNVLVTSDGDHKYGLRGSAVVMTSSQVITLPSARLRLPLHSADLTENVEILSEFQDGSARVAKNDFARKASTSAIRDPYDSLLAHVYYIVLRKPRRDLPAPSLQFS